MWCTQLKKEFGSTTSLPYFPPKKLFPLSSHQVDERRVELERFIQNGNHIVFVYSGILFRILSLFFKVAFSLEFSILNC